jgi:hypothetical protein
MCISAAQSTSTNPNTPAFPGQEYASIEHRGGYRFRYIECAPLSLSLSLFSKTAESLGSGPDFRHAESRITDALERTMYDALRDSQANGVQVGALALEATGSSVIPVGEALEPLDDY